MTMNFKLILLSTTLYVGLHTFPAAYAISEDEQQPQLKRAIQTEGNPAKRLKKAPQRGTPAANKSKVRKAPLKGSQASKRQKVQNAPPLDLSTWKAVKDTYGSFSQKNKKLAKQALQQIADDINHPDHAKAIKFARNKDLLKPDIALNKFNAILESNTTTLDQKEVALAYLIGHKNHHNSGVTWLNNFIDITPASDPNRHRFGLLFFKEVPYQSRSMYRSGAPYLSGRGQEILSEILDNPNHPLFMEACRKAFIGKVYLVDKNRGAYENYPIALNALKEKASDPLDPHHLEALFTLIIGNDQDSLIDPEECMSQLVLGHLKPLWTPNHPQYARITEHLFFYGDEDSKREAFPILLDNIRKGTYTKALKKASRRGMPASKHHIEQIKQAFADSIAHIKNQNSSGEESQTSPRPQASSEPQAKASPRQPLSALFEDSLKNQLTVCLNQPRLNLGRKTIEKPGSVYSLLMAEAHDEEERGLQQKIYEKIKHKLAVSDLDTQDIYPILKKFGTSKEVIDSLKARINLEDQVINKKKFITPIVFNGLLKHTAGHGNLYNTKYTKHDKTLYDFSETITDPEEKRLLVTLSHYRALAEAYTLYNIYDEKLHDPMSHIQDHISPYVKTLESLVMSDSPYALDALAILANIFEETKSDGKYKTVYRHIIESTHHKDRTRALLNYPLIDREYAQEHYLPLIEQLFHATPEESDPLLKNDAAAIAHFMETKDSGIKRWRQAQKPFNERGEIQDNFPTQFPYLWVDLHPQTLTKFTSLYKEYCQQALHIPAKNLEKFMERAPLPFFEKKVQEVLPELNSLVDSGNLEQFMNHPLWSYAFHQTTPTVIRKYALNMHKELGTKLFYKVFNNALPELDNLVQLGDFRTFLSHKIWGYGLNNFKDIHAFTMCNLVGRLPGTPHIVKTKFLEEAPQQLPLLGWEDSLVKERIMNLLAKINKEDKKHPEFYGLRSLLDIKKYYKKDGTPDEEKNKNWKTSKYRWDGGTHTPKTRIQGYDLLARQTEATLKKLLNMPLTKEEALVASPYNIRDEEKSQFINSLKHAIEYMESMGDPSLRNITLGMIIRALLFCETGQAEGINTAILNLVFKKQRLSSDFSHQLAAVMHEVVAGAFDLASAQKMPGQTAEGTHFQGQLRLVLHYYIGLPQVITGHTEWYNKITFAPYVVNLLTHFNRQLTVKYIVDNVLEKANDDKKFNNNLLGDTQVWLDSVNKEFRHYGINDEDPGNMKLTPELLIDYLIGKGWLMECAKDTYHTAQLPDYLQIMIMTPAIPVVQQAPAEQVQNPAGEGQNPAGQGQEP